MGYIVTLILIALLVIAIKASINRITVYEFERALKYDKGEFDEVAEPGQYWYVPFWTTYQKVDVRPRFVSITGQEVLSADGVTLKVSLAANYEIMDPNTAVNKVMDFQEALYLELQLALREIIGGTEIETVLNSRDTLSQKLLGIAAPKAEDLGLKLSSVNLKDVMFPGKLKEIFAQVVNAKQEGLAALERARGETAALRSLANAAKMIDSQPNLMQLRLVQALGETSGNTVVLGMPAQAVPLPVSHEKNIPEA